MQSTGHSSMHALSLMSTQGSAIVYVTASPQRILHVLVRWAAVRPAAGSPPSDGKAFQLLILDVSHTRQPLGWSAGLPRAMRPVAHRRRVQDVPPGWA